MIYFKDKAGKVSAYTKEDIEAVDNLSRIESEMSSKESNYSAALLSRQQLELKAFEIEYTEDNAELLNELSKEIAENQKIITEFQVLQNEYESIQPVFFDIREHLKVLKEMTAKEVEAHINPPMTKEQYVADAEMKKQLLADEAEKNITILERKVRLGMATDDDKDLLTAWEIYSVTNADVDTSKAPDIDWGIKPE
ncbi:tail fiber assembly protein [Providencia manganoxydans]|uniref:tail fiber assembly protein n=1 Tax=Providencia manganoxydans TaxID=2923283 RepID=UPI0034E583D0